MKHSSWLIEWGLPLLGSIFIVCVGLFSAGCMGGGSSSSSSSAVVGLTLPSQVSVIASAPAGGVGTGAIVAGALANTTGYAATSPYNTDVTQTWVFDSSMESLSTVNEILCYVQQTGATQMVNQGAYIALVNEKKCKQGQNQSGGQGGATQGAASNAGSTEVGKYQKWVVLSTRADNNSPQRVKVWVPPSTMTPTHPMDAQAILVEVTINESPSAAKPFGDFIMNFKGVMSQAGFGLQVGDPLMIGTLMSVNNNQSIPQFSFINLAGNAMPGMTGAPFSMTQATNVQMNDSNGTSGKAVTRVSETGMGPTPIDKKFAVAYGANGFLRGKDVNADNVIDSTVCTDRNNLKTTVWRYNLYNSADGSRVTVNSGFPFSQVNGQARFGHVGYWGVWTEDELGLNDGDVVTKESFGNGTAQQYTVNISNGKLNRRTKGTAAFTEVVGVDFFWWGDPADPFCNGGCANQGDYVINIAANGQATIVASNQWTNNGPKQTPLNPTVNITFVNQWDTLWLWSDAMGGSVVYANGAAALDFFKEDMVPVNDAAIAGGLSLVCYDRCPIGGVSAPTAENQIFYPLAQSVNGYTYTLAVANGKMTLTDTYANPNAEVNVTSIGGGGVFAQNYQWGISSGEMVTTTVAQGLVNWWDVYNANTTYRWETGPNNWNRQTAVTDAYSQIVLFDAPIKIDYTYDAGDDPSLAANVTTHPAGNKFLLEYGGTGDLWGFPWAQTDPTCDPYTTNCRWAPAVTLKSGVLLGNTSQYVVKQIEREQRMAVDGTNVACTGLSVTGMLADANFTLPTAVNGQVAITLAGKPTPADPAPAVIEGVLQ